MAKFKVVITDHEYDSMELERKEISKIDADFFDYQVKDNDGVVEIAKDADGIIIQYAKMPRSVIEKLEKCKVIVRYAVGYDGIDLEAATEKGICVCNVPDYGVDEVSDHAVLLLLAIARKLFVMHNSVHEGLWDYKITKPVYRLKGKKLGLIGFGRIPRLVAQKAQGFGIEVCTFDPYVTKEAAAKCNVELVDFDTLIKESDFISIHVPLTSETRHMFNEDVFRKMKKTAYIINTGRGPIIDQNALIDALDKGYISGAALDVTEKEPVEKDNPLLNRDNVIITPHSAWYSEEALQALQRMAAEEIVRVLSGYMPRNLVNKDVKDKLDLKPLPVE